MSLRLTQGDENHGVRWFSTVPQKSFERRLQPLRYAFPEGMGKLDAERKTDALTPLSTLFILCPKPRVAAKGGSYQ
jgi:hypothetical protein